MILYIFFLLLLIILITFIFLVYFLISDVIQVKQKKKAGPLFKYPLCDIGGEVNLDNHRLKLFNYGKDVFHDMLIRISQAQKYILLESYIFTHDRVGKIFKKFLIKRAKAGVKVYIIFDGLGNLFVPHDFWRRLIRAGVHVFEYGPIRTFLAYFNYHTFIRDHRKLLIIDDKVAYLGGLNIGREYEKRWRDTHLRIEGPVVRNIKKIFIDFWNKNNKKNPIKMKADWIRSDKIKVYYNDITGKIYQTRPLFLNFINRATQKLFLTFSYFAPDEEFLSAIGEARNRGVEVEIILPEKSDIRPIDYFARSLYERLLRLGVKIFLYQKTMIHAKTMVADDRWSIVGSCNLENRGFYKNYEIVTEIENQDFTQRLEQLFECDKKNCRKVDLKKWLKRSKREIFWEKFFGFFTNFM